MRRRPLFAFTTILLVAGLQTSANASEVMMRFFPLTGEVRMQNTSAVPFDFIFYSIESPSGALNGANGVWTSIADTYDASGNGFIDPVNDWSELSDSSDELTEGLIVFIEGTHGILPASRSISLGKIWNSSAALMPDVAVDVRKADGLPATVHIEYALDGDYNLDNKVDLADFTLWKAAFGFTFTPFIDGNLNGVVDAADYTIWRDNLGASLVGTVFESAAAAEVGALSASAVVPEPTTIALVITGTILLGCGRYWTRSRTA